ncbi:11_t:CDS:2 [Funneliformis caledonium]|uniref:11_t:CDS:1 n=1 Tax=Funneliformis caledonium TaxID=1117310 RepID=A0A9N9BKP9_9GLOM|nr:11_t:CDS:2 [Funneliformis caledonium]
MGQHDVTRGWGRGMLIFGNPVGTQFSGSLMALTFRKPMGTSFLLQSRSRAEVFCLSINRKINRN